VCRTRTRCIARTSAARPPAGRLPEARLALDDAVEATNEEEATGPWPATARESGS